MNDPPAGGSDEAVGTVDAPTGGSDEAAGTGDALTVGSKAVGMEDAPAGADSEAVGMNDPPTGAGAAPGTNVDDGGAPDVGTPAAPSACGVSWIWPCSCSCACRSLMICSILAASSGPARPTRCA